MIDIIETIEVHRGITRNAKPVTVDGHVYWLHPGQALAVVGDLTSNRKQRLHPETDEQDDALAGLSPHHTEPIPVEETAHG